MQISGKFLVRAAKLNINKYINIVIFIDTYTWMQNSLFARLLPQSL